MSPETTTSLRLTRIIKADPQRVFEAFTQEEQLKEWSCPEGGTVAKAEVDLRIDGEFCIVMDTSRGGTPASTAWMCSSLSDRSWGRFLATVP